MARRDQSPLATQRTEPGLQENLLMLEGTSDFMVMKGLLIAHKLTGKTRLIEESGIEGLLSKIGTRMDESGLIRLGVVVDTDDDLIGRWQSVRNVLIGSDCNFDPLLVPNQPAHDGTIIAQEGKPRVGVWLMPNNQQTGALENFLASLVRQEDTLWPYAEKCVQDLPPEIWQNANWKSKARMYSWLAWQKEPGYPVGQAVRFYMNPQAPSAQAFMSWVKRLFELDSAS